MKHFWVLFLAFSVMTLSGQTTTPSQAKAPQDQPKPQTIIMNSGGGLYIFNEKHEVAAYCEKVTGKVVENCKIASGHTATEVVQGLLNTLIH